MIVSRLRNNRGFTLVEIMIAIFVLVIALVGLISVTTMIIRGNSFSKTMTTATTLARDKMEQLKNTTYVTLVAGTYTDYATYDSTVQVAQQADSIYTRSWTIIPNIPAPGMTTVTVNVQWSWQGAARNVSLSTIIAE